MHKFRHLRTKKKARKGAVPSYVRQEGIDMGKIFDPARDSRRKLVRDTEKPLWRLVGHIYLSTFGSENLPEPYGDFYQFNTKWRNWTQDQCEAFLRLVLKVEQRGQFVDSISCLGYAPKTILYR